MDWLYSHKVLHVFPGEKQNLLFLFADQYDVPALRKQYIDLVFDDYPCAGQCVPPRDSSRTESLQHVQDHMSDMYEGTTHGSSFRKILVDTIVWRDMEYAEFENVHEWIRSQPDLATDLLLALCKKEKTKNPFLKGQAKNYYDDGIVVFVNARAAADSK